MKLTLLTLTVVTAAMALAFDMDAAASPRFWLTLGLPYLALAALAVYKLWDEGALLDVLTPRWGDLSLGVMTGAVLLFTSFGARAVLAPAGSTRLGWLFRIYAQLGNPDAVQRSALYTSALFGIVICEELVWRSMVLDELTARFGPRRAWPLCALCYGAAALPTLFTLRDPVAGYNPLLVTAALGCGIVWSFLTSIKGRLVPALIAHGVFTYFSLVQFRWPFS